MSTPVSRRAHAQVAAHSRWAQEPDRQQATVPARRGLEARWAREIDPTGTLAASDPEELERRIASARQAHMARMRLARSQRAAARRERVA